MEELGLLSAGQLASALLEPCSGTVVEFESWLREGSVDPGPKPCGWSLSLLVSMFLPAVPD